MLERKQQRKIALVGTSCVGKSEVWKYFKEQPANSPQIVFVDEAAREYFAKNPNIPETERFSAQHQGAIQELQMENEQAAHKSGVEIILCDRSVLDAVVYVRGHGDRKGSDSLLKRVQHWIPTYHTIFLLDPKDVPYVQDNIRQETPEIRQRNHDAFVELFSEAQIPHEMISGTLEQRIKKVQEVILFKR